MGWKVSAIIINKPVQTDNEALLKELGFMNLAKIESEPFETAMNPKDNTVYIGSYKDNLLICTPDIPMFFLEDKETETEMTLKQIFSNSEICSIILHSTVNLWGYSIIKKGQRVRIKAGSADDGTFVDFGEPLDEEKELLSKSKLDENGNRIYLLDDFPDEPLTEDQVGENFVFSICKRYFEEELDMADDLLFETVLTGYKYKKIEKAGKSKNTSKNLPNDDKKSWWKFW